MAHKSWNLLAAALVLTPQLPALAQDKPPLVLTPASPWNVNYANDSCRLGRAFKDGGSNAIFYIDQFEPGPTMNVLVASKAFKSYAGSKVVARFGPMGGERTLDRAWELTLGKNIPAIMASNLVLVDNAPAGADAAATPDSNVLVEAKEATPEQAEAITWFEVQRGTRSPVRFALGAMRAPLAALRTCTEELVAHWGIDVVAHRTLSRKPTPASNPGSWASNSDYPAHLVAQGVQGIIYFRLLIDTDGKVSSCHIQQSTRPAEFDRKVCEIMSKRARFEPALDAQGQPIKSYWRSTFRFAMP